MWFVTTFAAGIILFVLTISIDAGIKDIGRPKEIPLRLVSVKGVRGGVQVLVDGVWASVCNDTHFEGDRILSFCNQAKKRKLTHPETNTSTPMGFVSLKCNTYLSCLPVHRASCSGGEAKVPPCDDQGPTEYNDFDFSYYIFRGDTVANCTATDNLWVTYEHSFFEISRMENKRDNFTWLSGDVITWTSSYIKNTNLDPAKEELCLVDNTNSTLVQDCIDFCLSAVPMNQPLSAVGMQNSDCQCFTAYDCNNRPNGTYDMYKTVTSERSHTSTSEMEYCIAMKQHNNTRTFMALNCSVLLPQLCGTTRCWPKPPCKSGKCKLTANFTAECDLPDQRYIVPNMDADHGVGEQSNLIYILVTCIGGAIVVVLVVFCIICLVRSGMWSGEGQRPNSIANRTYGNSLIRTSLVLVEEESYDLIDEYAIARHDNMSDTVINGISVLGDYSSPTDAISSKTKQGDDYTTTYDDPIRKLSLQTEAIQLNSVKLRETEIGNDDSMELAKCDIELNVMKRQYGFPEAGDKETDGKKNQFKGCLCSMNVSAESDIEPFDQASNVSQHEKNETAVRKAATFDCSITDSLKEKCSFETVNDQRCYYTLAAEAPVKDSEYVREARFPENKSSENDSGSDYEDTTVISNKWSETKRARFCKCREGARNTDEDSDYEDSDVVVGEASRRRHVTLPENQNLSIHSPPEELQAKLGVRIVPSECTYETYSALPKSRADLMNPYYSYLHDLRVSEGIKRENNDIEKSTDDSTDRNDKENVYDRLYNATRCFPKSNNTYDHIVSLWTNQSARKRVNSW